MSYKGRLSGKDAKNKPPQNSFQKSGGFVNSAIFRVKSSRDIISGLQRTLGNRALERLWRSGVLQKKLRIGRANDRYEPEAGRVTDSATLLSVPTSTPGAEKTTIQRAFVNHQAPENETGTTEFPPARNNTGLPDNLKSGIESLSGIAMDSVRVHYNSPWPVRLNASAYTKGENIHIASGQERHLPHEAWHVVQQAQGRVRPTFQLRGQMKGIGVNDDTALEREADVMGKKAMQLTRFTTQPDKVQSALTATALQRGGNVLQGVFVGFGGGGWAPDNSALPGNLNIFPGGLNKMGGGQQGGATTRVMDISTKSAYSKPTALGGFTFFSVLFGNAILNQPGGKNKRYTHMHVINGKLHGPGGAANMTLGSTADNNAHNHQVEAPIRQGLYQNDTATVYKNNMAANPPFSFQANKAYWNKPGLNMIGAKPVAPGAKVLHNGVMKPYTHWADSANLINATHWVHYTVAPNYANALSPTIRQNIAIKYQKLHKNETDDLRLQTVPKLAPPIRPAANTALANADLALNGIVIAGALIPPVNPTLAAGNIAAAKLVTANFKGGAVALDLNAYNNNMATNLNNMTNFEAWAVVSFPVSLTCDADLYKASYDPANLWFKRSEAQTILPINQN